MQYTKIAPTVQNSLEQTLALYPKVTLIARALHDAGAQVFLVGGAVRDLLLGKEPKDLDIEVHGLAFEKIEQILQQFGLVSTVGKSFGVMRVHGIDVDWSLPRSDSSGRKPMVTIDPNMDINQAFKRRDVTMNAMGIDLFTFELVDPFGGAQDLVDKKLRATDPDLFLEDPLRFFRVMQFVGRFGMTPDQELNNVCKHMDLTGVSRERIEEEYAKWLLKSSKPSLALEWLDQIGRLKELMPEIAALKGLEQESTWHPEGDVYEHSKQAVDAAARLTYPNDREKLITMYAALCHDLGKVNRTRVIKGRITNHGHADESKQLVTVFLKRFTRDSDLITSVQKLVEYHMHPGQFVSNGAKADAYKRLALKLAPEITLEMLSKVFIADRQGRNPQQGSPLNAMPADVITFLERASQANVLSAVEPALLKGRDFLDVVQGPQLGQLVKLAYQLQIRQGITDKNELKQKVLRQLFK